MVNSDYWHWYMNSDDDGIHFSFAKPKVAVKFKKKFKTSNVYEVVDMVDRTWHCIKILDQDSPTEQQFTWLNRCKME